MTHMGAPRARRLGSVLLPFAGPLVAWAGFHWDIAWHGDIGRDRFLSVPHVMIMAGMALWALVGLRGVWGRTPRDAVREAPGLVLLAASAGLSALTLAFDDSWHRMFGFDVTIWSPPHLLLVSTFHLGMLGALLHLARRRPRLSLAGAAIATALPATVLMTLVHEYEYGFVHFRALWWPWVLVAVTAYGAGMAHAWTRRRWAVTLTVLAILGVRLAAVGLNLSLGRSAPVLPFAVLVPALIWDALLPMGPAPRRTRVWATLAAGAAALYLVQIPINDLTGRATWPTADPLLALAGTMVSAIAAFALGRRIGEWLRGPVAETPAPRSMRVRALAAAALLSVPMMLTGIPQLANVSEGKPVRVEASGNQLSVKVPGARASDHFSVFGPIRQGCDTDCPEHGGFRWYARLTLGEDDTYHGVVNALGDWITLWYVGGDSVWQGFVEYGRSGETELKRRLFTTGVARPLPVVASYAGLLLVMLACGLSVTRLFTAGKPSGPDDATPPAGGRPLSAVTPSAGSAASALNGDGHTDTLSVFAPGGGIFRPLPPSLVTSEGEWARPGQLLAVLDDAGGSVEVRAPEGGVVVAMMRSPGEPVHPGDELFRLARER